MRKEVIKSLALKAAVAGIFAGAVMMPGCGKDSAKTEQNGCGGANGCGGQNGCNGANGCNGQHEKKVEEKAQ